MLELFISAYGVREVFLPSVLTWSMGGEIVASRCCDAWSCSSLVWGSLEKKPETSDPVSQHIMIKQKTKKK